MIFDYITPEQMFNEPKKVEKMILNEIKISVIRAVDEWILDRLFAQINLE